MPPPGVETEDRTAATLADLVRQIADAHGPRLEKVLTACSFLVDGAQARDPGLALAPGTVVDVLPPVRRRMTSMSVFDKAKAKAEQLLGRAEELYGQSHGDAAATLGGEARRLEGEVEEEAAEREEAAGRGRGGPPARGRRADRRPLSGTVRSGTATGGECPRPVRVT